MRSFFQSLIIVLNLPAVFIGFTANIFAAGFYTGWCAANEQLDALFPHVNRDDSSDT